MSASWRYKQQQQQPSQQQVPSASSSIPSIGRRSVNSQSTHTTATNSTMSSASAANAYLPQRPPAQVFTRGTFGSVKTQSSVAAGPTDVLAVAVGDPRRNGSTQLQQQHLVNPAGDRRRSRSQTRKEIAARSAAPPAGTAAPPRPRNRSHSLQPAKDTITTTSNGSILSTGSSSNYSNNVVRSNYSQPDSCSDQGSVQSAPSNDLRWDNSSSKSRGSRKDTASQQTNRDSSPTRSDTSEKFYIKTTRRVMDDLSRASGPERRVTALTHLCESFDHNDEVRHNMELANGALTVLAKSLQVATQDDESRMIAAALEMVCRGNTKSLQLAYNKVGATLLVHLVRMLERCEMGSLKHAEVTILNVTKVLFYLSRCSDLRVTLCRQQGMLDALKRLRNLNEECRLMRMKIIANLASSENNKVLMYEHNGLVDAIVRVAHMDSNELARQFAGAALMDLASAPPNQVPMANDDKVLGTLVKMVLVEQSMVTRESVITALQNLAFAKENRFRLVSFKDGVLLEALKQALASDLDAKARRRAAGALTNLVCDETAELMGNHKGLLDTLAIVSTKDDNLDVQTRASLALTKIANCITVQMACHDALLDALVVASLSKANNSVSAVLRVKARDPDNRETMARHPGVIDTLADICASEGAKVSDRDNAMRAIMHLINEQKNRKIMCNKIILDALVTGANYQEPDLEEARESAIRAMERLATEYANRAFMARHEGLLVAVARAVEREAQWEDDGRDSEHGYLAKPLLMSLLVAM